MRTARTLSRLAPAAKGLPPLWFVTDPRRTPDPEAIARRLPRGAGVIYRHFGAVDAERRARTLSAIARRRGLILLIGADPALARKVGAAGVHLPERMTALAPRLVARGMLVTAAAHGAAGLARAKRLGCRAALLSPVFESRSPSAGRPLGAVRFAALARGAGLPVFALGGIDMRTAKRLGMSGAAGLAAVAAFGL
jgi:thiamine-phosphate pyrophosphorylase